MRDLAPDLPASDIAPVADPACCPGGACGPIFETPLLELAFNRIRGFVRGRNAATVAEATPADLFPSTAPANPLPEQVLSTTPAVAAPPGRPRKDAPRD
jgi:hypothetical protein